MKFKLIPIEENKDPYYHIIFNYMIGDGNGNNDENKKKYQVVIEEEN